MNQVFSKGLAGVALKVMVVLLLALPFSSGELGLTDNDDITGVNDINGTGTISGLSLAYSQLTGFPIDATGTLRLLGANATAWRTVDDNTIFINEINWGSSDFSVVQCAQGTCNVALNETKLEALYNSSGTVTDAIGIVELSGAIVQINSTYCADGEGWLYGTGCVNNESYGVDTDTVLNETSVNTLVDDTLFGKWEDIESEYVNKTLCSAGEVYVATSGCINNESFGVDTDTDTVLNETSVNTLVDLINETSSESFIFDTDNTGNLNTTGVICDSVGCIVADTDTTYTFSDALTETAGDVAFDGGATPGGELNGTWANPTIDSSIHDDEYIELGDAFYGFLTGTYQSNSANWSQASDITTGGALANDVVAADEMADADHGDVNWTDGVAIVENLQCSSCVDISSETNLANSTGILKDGDTISADEAWINTTIDNRIVSIYYNATESVTIAGTVDSGTLADTQHQDGAYDGLTFNFSETATTPGLDLRMNFTNIPDFNVGVLRYKTSDLKGDYPIIQLWSYDDGEWEDYPVVGESSSFATITQAVFDSTGHLNDSVVQMRIYKAAKGNTNNNYYIDWVAIIDGPGTPAGEEVDPLSFHTGENLNNTDYNVSADYFIGIASTATSSASNGYNCPAGSYPLGVNESFGSEDCTDASTEINTAIATKDECSEITNCVPSAWDALTDMVLTDNYIYVGDGSNDPVGVALSNDCTIASDGAITCDHDALDNYAANEHLDWTASVGTIHSDNYADTDTVTTVGDGLTLTGTQVNMTACGDTEIRKYNITSHAWECESDVNTDTQNTYTGGDAVTITSFDIDFDGGATPAGELGGSWASPTVDDGIHDDEYQELEDELAGDVTGKYNETVVGDDSHNHVIANIDAFTEADLETRMSLDVYTENDGDLNEDDVNLSDVQLALENDFHNVGGIDDDIPENGDFNNAVSLDSSGTVINNGITPDMLLNSSQTDEYCLKYESTGDTWAWDVCDAYKSSRQWTDNGTHIVGNSTFTDIYFDGNLVVSGNITSGSGNITLDSSDIDNLVLFGVDNRSVTIRNATINSESSVDSTALTDGGTISFDWIDAEIDDDLTINENGSVDDGALPASISSDITGNAATSSALAANGDNCGVGNYSLGTDTSGNAESCTDATIEIDLEIANVLDGSDTFTVFTGADVINPVNLNESGVYETAQLNNTGVSEFGGIVSFKANSSTPTDIWRCMGDSNEVCETYNGSHYIMIVA